MLDLDLESHALLALDAVVGVGEEVVGALESQRHRYGQRLPELVLATVILERIIVPSLVHGAVQVDGVVVGLDHRRVRIRIENYKKIVLENVDW